MNCERSVLKIEKITITPAQIFIDCSVEEEYTLPLGACYEVEFTLYCDLWDKDERLKELKDGEFYNSQFVVYNDDATYSIYDGKFRVNYKSLRFSRWLNDIFRIMLTGNHNENSLKQSLSNYAKKENEKFNEEVMIVFD